MNKISYKLTLFFIVWFLQISNVNAVQTVRIGVVLDGPSQREILSLSSIIKEVTDLTEGEFNIVFPADKQLSGNWHVDGIQSALKKLLNDPDVDIIIAKGLLSSHQAAQIKKLGKPVIAPIVADRILQELPYDDGTSGKYNYVYISDNRTVAEDLKQFRELVPFEHLAIPADKLFLDALPQLKGTVFAIQQELGFELSLLPIKDSPLKAINSMSSDVDAVYVPPLMRFNKENFKQLSQALIDRKLPSFSLLGRSELDMGILATLSGRDIETTRYARRIALYVQSILLGANAANLKVNLNQPAKLAINMETAREIGFSPKWRFLEVADLLHEEEVIEGQRSISLVEAIGRAVDANLSLQTDRQDLELSKDNVSANRSALLPQLSVGVGTTQLDRDSAATSSQRSSDASVTATQVIYSESKRSGYDVAKLLERAQSANLQISILNVMSSSATAYLQLLSAQATEKVRKSNLNVTETNLELAKTRLNIGYSDRSEVLRWQSQLATDRRNLYSAEASHDQAETALKQQLHLPLSEGLSVTDDGIAEHLGMLGSERFKRFFDNPFNFAIFTEFEVQRAKDNAPELEQIEHTISSNEREVKAAKRAYYVPDVNLTARYGNNLERGGFGSSNPNLLDDNWSVGIEASLPLFSGGARKAEVSRSSNTLIQNRYRKEDTQEQIETRVLSALQKTSGSYPAMRLSRDAVVAAEESLSLVTDAYSQGTVSITDLLDAQDTALEANLAAVEAEYTFMIDWVEIQRAVANFDLLLTPDGFENWYQALDRYYTTRNQ